MGIHRRCTECRCSFAPSPRALTTQRVCGPACRVARDRKLARARRRREIDDYRADERRRQEESRADRAKTAAGAPARCHAPPSARKPPDLHEEVLQIVDRVLDVSRAILLRDLRRSWPQPRGIVAKAGRVSRATFGAQVCDPTAESGAIPAACHA